LKKYLENNHTSVANMPQRTSRKKTPPPFGSGALTEKRGLIAQACFEVSAN
jgi:hypothetical protein